MRRGERGLVIYRAAFLPPGQLRLADHPAQPPVSLRVTGEHQQMPAGRIWNPALPAGQIQAELGTENCLDRYTARPQPGGSLSELGYPVHPIVISDGQRGQAARGRLADQVRRAGSTVEEAVRRVAMQLGPGRILAA
jgi:hypothetical protein